MSSLSSKSSCPTPRGNPPVAPKPSGQGKDLVAGFLSKLWSKVNRSANAGSTSTSKDTKSETKSATRNPTSSSGAGHNVRAHHRARQSPQFDDAASTETIENINATLTEEVEEQETSNKGEPELERCVICMDDYTDPKKLDKCGHTFCRDCIDQYFHSIKPQCPCCFTVYGDIRGNQPEGGKMTYTISKHRLPGFGRSSNGTIKISYYFPDGIQDEKHPSPGQRYRGTSRDAYLPDNREGREVLRLLQKAFELRQTFTIGQSRTTGKENVVTWNDIHHKTNYSGGTENFGYPDPTYLNRVRQELAAKGIQ